MGSSKWILLLLAGCLLGADVRAEELPLPPMDMSATMAPPAGNLGGQSQQEELIKLQAQVKDLLAQAQGIKENQDRVVGQLDRLLNATGVRFSGQAVVDSVNFLRLNPLADAQRTWPTVGYFDFHITAHPRADLQADVVYRMEKIFGGFWGALDVAGVKYFNITGQTPIGFELGMVNYKHTPLTFWVPIDRYEFEPEIQARKRREGMDELYIKDNSFPLQGVKLDASVLLFSALDLDLEAVGFRTAIAGNKNSGLSFAVTYPYDQYLIGSTARLSLEGNKAASIGTSYFELVESPDTAQVASLYGQQRGDVAGADLKLELGGGFFKLSGEGVQSNYTPMYGNSVTTSGGVLWTTGNAGDVLIDVGTPQNSLSLHGLYVEETFINYAAQTRAQDTQREASGEYATANNLYNPKTGDYSLSTVNNLFFNRYNNVVVATNQGPSGGLVTNKFGMQPAALLLTYGVLQQSLPYGLATPNRSGGGVEYKGSWMNGFLQPRATMGSYQEIYTAWNVPQATGPRKYLRGGGGLKVDFAPTFGLPLDLQAGVIVEDTRSDSFVAFTSTRIGYDLHWQLTKEFHLLLGFQHADFNGADFRDTGSLVGATWNYQNWLTDDYLGGFSWQLSKSTEVNLTYSFLDAINADNLYAPGPNFQDQEYECRVRMRF